MSILLEALRKSEQNQHAHEAPTIHTDDQSGKASEPLQTLPLALLLVVALFAVGWFAWQQYRPAVGVYRPPVTLPAVQGRAATTPVVPPEADGGQLAQAAPATTPVNKSAGQQRTPVESFKPEPEKRPGKPATSSANRQPVPATGDNASQPAPKAASPDKPKTGTRENQRSREPAPISYWALPDAIRADVPEIKFSVLVYAKNPADRFVLINGQRLGEGDSSQPGLVVKEIRRDGVVFSYRLYQFLVER